jgi:GT2 family glycosyltransferase
MNPSRAAAIIVTHECEGFLTPCLGALRGSTQPLDVIVVDNGSSDGTVALVEREFPEVTLIAQENAGFAAGNNRGLAWLRGRGYRYALLVNPDVVVTSHCVERLTAFLDAHEDVALVSPKVHYGDGRTILFAGSWFDWAAGTTPQRGMGEEDSGQYDDPAAIDCACGAAMMVRLSAVEKVGPMVEDYFLYFEEADWSRRFTAAGYAIWYVPAAVCIHEPSSSIGKGSARFWYYFTRNNLLFMSRFARGGWVRFRLALARRSAYVMWLCLLKMNAPSFACMGAIIRGHVDFALRRFGRRW